MNTFVSLFDILENGTCTTKGVALQASLQTMQYELKQKLDKGVDKETLDKGRKLESALQAAESVLTKVCQL